MPPAVVPPMSSAVSASVTTRERKGSPFLDPDLSPPAACARARSLISSSSSGVTETRSSRRRSATSSSCSGIRSSFEFVICSLIRTGPPIRNRRPKKILSWRDPPSAPIMGQVRDDDFERLYATHAEALLGFLVYRTSDRALAEDVVADTFERVLRTRFRFDPRKSSEKTWLYTIALNLLRDRARRQAVESQALERAMEPVGGGRGQIEAVDERDELKRALARLSPEEREAVALRFGADLTLPEIAKLTGESRSTVHGRVYRGLEKMRGKLA